LRLDRSADAGRGGRAHGRGEQVLERGHVAALCRSDERMHESLVLDPARRPTSTDREVLARTADELAGVRLRDLQHLGDLRVGVVERLPQDVRGSFGR
jgi:hypothetical protein